MKLVREPAVDLEAGTSRAGAGRQVSDMRLAIGVGEHPVGHVLAAKVEVAGDMRVNRGRRGVVLVAVAELDNRDLLGSSGRQRSGHYLPRHAKQHDARGTRADRLRYPGGPGRHGTRGVVDM